MSGSGSSQYVWILPLCQNPPSMSGKSPLFSQLLFPSLVFVLLFHVVSCIFWVFVMKWRPTCLNLKWRPMCLSLIEATEPIVQDSTFTAAWQTLTALPISLNLLLGWQPNFAWILHAVRHTFCVKLALNGWERTRFQTFSWGILSFGKNIVPILVTVETTFIKHSLQWGSNYVQRRQEAWRAFHVTLVGSCTFLFW